MKIVCQVCGVIGYLQQIGKNYYRIRHYVSYKNGKPLFKCHKQDPEYVHRLLRQKVIDQIDHSNIDPKNLKSTFFNENKRAGSLVWIGRKPPKLCLNDIDNGKHVELSDVLKDFYNFLVVELRLEEPTAKNHFWNLKRFLKAVGKKPSEISRVDVRNYLLEEMQSKAQATVNNYLKTLKRFFRDYQRNSSLVESFKFKQSEFKQKRVPSKAEIKRFYEVLPNIENQAVFLMYASSGWRAKEVVSLLRKNIDLQQRRLYAVKNSSRTKHVGYGFFNEETARKVTELLKDKPCQEDEHAFLSYKTLRQTWVETSKKSGVKITPQVLREWFCSEMGRLRVPDRYIDAFCGRVPNSILARHYTDYNSEILKEIYDKADLKVLS